MTGTISDFQIYEEQFFAGVFEVLERNVAAFNENTRGAIRLVTDFMKGNFEQESFFQKPSNLIVDRDTTSTASATPTKMTMDEFVAAKTNKRIGPVQNTLDSFKKIGRPISEMAFILGQQTAPDIQAAYLSSGVNALVGAFSVAGLSGLVQDGTSGAVTNLQLIRTLAKLGDQAQRVRVWVMHSKVYFDLMEHNVSEKLLEVTAGTLYEGSIPTLGRPVFVTDTPALFSAGSSTTSTSADDVYWTFGLVENALEIRESEERSMLIEVVGGLNNLVARYQGEFAYNVRLKGMKWSTGTTNPSDSALATNSNWSMAAADTKSLMGVALKTR